MSNKYKSKFRALSLSSAISGKNVRKRIESIVLIVHSMHRKQTNIWKTIKPAIPMAMGACIAHARYQSSENRWF